MKKKDKKTTNKAQLLKELDKLKKDLFNFRFQKINSQVKDPSKIKETRKNIARIKTQLMEKANA
jgi:large subunit ribosomal protein L29|tara:strand:- start:377 stop:568 length:192 start_codon:yes stop_codon:yes gene_type:complete